MSQVTDRDFTSRQRDPSGAGAGAAIDGYDYQLDVSVLAAVDLMLAKKLASRITLEPANEEDLAADLAPDVPGRVQPAAQLDSYELVIQVKLRNTGPWDLASFKALMKHGKRRAAAETLLLDPERRYLLVTSAAASGVLNDILVEDFAAWPSAESCPASLVAALPPGSAGRVAIWGGLSERGVRQETDLLLTGLLHVPEAALAGCREKLRSEAKLRMRGKNPGVWLREDLVAVIRSFGGYLASAPELDIFVRPANWDVLVERLRSRNAVVITGPSGTGKTWAALALSELRRGAQPGLNVIPVSGEPSDARPLVDRGPTLFYVEDPWGQNSLRAGSEAWSEQLPRMLRQASGDRQYIVTTRSDMLQSARGEAALGNWNVELNADQYADGQLAAIYDKRMGALPPFLQSKALHFRSRALQKLETPLEVDIYFGGFAEGPEAEEGDEVFFLRVVGLAHRDAIEGTVVKKLAAADDTGWAAVLWALIATQAKVERPALVAIQSAMRRSDPFFRDGLERLTNVMVAARHLRQPGSAVSFAHPSVRAGFRTFVGEEPGRSAMAMEALLSALVQLTGPWQDWGLETAARIIVLARGEDMGLDVPTVVQAAVDAWIDRTLMSDGSDFGRMLELASDAGSDASNPSELARWFLKGTQRGGNVFLDTWQPPTFDDAWYERLSADPRSREIAGRFVREFLPDERDRYGRSFPERLDRIAVGLAPAFADAALRMVSGGFGSNVEMVAAGAVRDLSAATPAFHAALDALAADRRDDAARLHPRWIRIQNGEFDFSEEEHFQRSHEEDGWAAGVFVDAYVARLRADHGWQAILRHPRAEELARPWARAIAHAPRKPAVAEARALIALATASGVEHVAWQELRQNWPARLNSDILRRTLSDPEGKDLRQDLARCLVTVAGTMLAPLFSELAARPATLIALLVDLRAAGREFSRERLDPVTPASARLLAWARALYRALPTKTRQAGRLRDAHAAEVIAAIGRSSATTLEKVVPVLVASGERPLAAVERWLQLANSPDSAEAAVEIAAGLGDEGALRLALGHDWAKARAAAVRALAPPAPVVLSPKLLAMAADPSSFVRRAVVELLARSRHPEHKAALLRLAHDPWSSADAFYDEEPARLIAREALASLAGYDGLDRDEGAALIEIARETPDADVRAAATRIAADLSTADVRRRLWAIGVEPTRRWIRVDALYGLALARSVEQDIVAGVTGSLLLDQPAIIAAAATCLLANQGEPEAVAAMIESVAQSGKRRAFLLIGASLLAERGRRDLAGQLLGLLPRDHPAARLLDLKKGERLPANALDDLGGVRVRKAVADWLGDRLAR